jgi:hypothetical protein
MRDCDFPPPLPVRHVRAPHSKAPELSQYSARLDLGESKGVVSDMRIAQVAPLYESCPPQLYGGT